MSTDAALPTFVAEARELLREMEGALLSCEQASVGADTINAIFRAAHTIKGSSGLFGLDAIVAFAHVVENVLDRVRGAQLVLDEEWVSLLLECVDHIGDQVASVAAGGQANDAVLSARSAELVDRIKRLEGVVQDSQPRFHAQSYQTEIGGVGIACTECWHISLRFKPDVLRNGMDPLSFIRYLTTFGQIASIAIVDDAMPPANQLDAETCYLGFEINFRTEADKLRIESAFEFVREDCTLHILPPRSHVTDYLRLLEDLPEGDARLGDILVKLGTLTQRELADALRLQKEMAASSGGAPLPLGEILVQEKMVQAPVVEAALEKQRLAKEIKLPEARSIRIDADKLEKLIDLIGELIIAGASTNLIAQQAGLADLNESAHRLSRLVEEVRDHALKLRMVQIGTTFSRFQRVVRDMSREMNKDIRLEVGGGETELDKTLIERISDPVTHLVRNAIDHGIEESAARVAAGKSAQGVIKLNAYHESGLVVIEVADDGGGLRRERILKKAVERGLIADGAVLTDAEVHALIFSPGFSTAEHLTNLSGRGVGMDVVKSNIEALRGVVEIDSREGKGTVVRIRLPLTLAIIDGFLVSVGRSSYVIPLDLVEECVELSADERAAIGDHKYFNLRGSVLPFIRLRELFGVQARPSRRESMVVAQFAGKRIGLVVDELLGEFQTVIKPMARMFNHLKCIAGSTILGNGSVALILDVAALAQRAETHGPGRVPSAILGGLSAA